MRRELLRTKPSGIPPKKRLPEAAVVLLILVVIGAVVLIYLLIRSESHSGMISQERYYLTRTEPSSLEISHPSPRTENKSDLQKLIANSRRSLVLIENLTKQGSAHTGSGFIATANGYILTCQHVIDDAQEVYARLADGTQKGAKIISLDIENDLALIKIEGERLSPLKLGNSDKIMPGEQILVMGFPLGSKLGSEPTVSQGMISAIRENGKKFQCDVAVNRGNSGGPVISSERGR